MKRKLITTICIITMIGTVYGMNAHAQSTENTKKELLRVGVYDSRAIATAYGATFLQDNLKKMHKELMEAEKNRDVSKIKELTTQTQQQQLASNWQGMGIEPVHECFVPIRDKIPAVVQQAGVDILINKWSMDYASGDAGFVDLTDELVKLFNPDKGTLKWIESLKKSKPLTSQLSVAHTLSSNDTSEKNKQKSAGVRKPPCAIVTKDAAVFQFLIEDVKQRWQWDDTYDMALEYAWWVEITLGEKVYTIGYSHFQGPGSTAKQGYLQELLLSGQVDVWDQGRSVLRGKGLRAEVNESGILIHLTDPKLLQSIHAERPEKAIFKSEGQKLKKNKMDKTEEITVQYPSG